MFLLRDYLVDILLIVYAFKNIFQILRSDKVNAPFPANRYFKGTKRIVKATVGCSVFVIFQYLFVLSWSKQRPRSSLFARNLTHKELPAPRTLHSVRRSDEMQAV